MGDTAGDESEQQITFNVKSSADAKHIVTVPLSSTVADLKQKLSTAEYFDLAPERQRLIYSGRVLKDADSVASCKIKDGNTVHLVRGAESNQRQNPANQGGAAVPSTAGQPAGNVPTNIAAGSGAGNPLAHLTGARYAGFHGLPGADMFGADGGMGAPPSASNMLRMLEDPNFAQQMNEAMNNPAVLDHLRNNPMIRDNPAARAAIENPEMRRLMFNPDMIRMQMRMQEQMGGGGGASAFPMPGQTDTTPATDSTAAAGTQNQTPGSNPAAPNPANPFAALFGGGGAGAGTAGGAGAAQNPFGNLFGNQAGGAAGQPQLSAMAEQLMQNPEALQQMMQAFGGGGGAGGAGAGNPFGGFGGGMGGFGGFGAPAEPQAPADTRPPEERYEEQLRQLNDMGFHDFDKNVQALRRSGGSVQGAVEYLFSTP